MKLNCKSYVFVNPVEFMQATLSVSELNYIVPYAYGALYAYGMPIRVWDRENAHMRTGYPIRVWDKIRVRDATEPPPAFIASYPLFLRLFVIIVVGFSTLLTIGIFIYTRVYTWLACHLRTKLVAIYSCKAVHVLCIHCCAYI